MKKDEKFEEHEVIGNWEVIDQIGEGGLGLVYKAKNIKSAVEGALKQAKYLKDSNKLWREAVKMVKLKNRNIVKLFEVIENPISKQVVLVMEYVAGGSLHHQLACRKTFSLVDGWHVMKQMASAFAYIHSENIVHRDIKVTHFFVYLVEARMRANTQRTARGHETKTVGNRHQEICGRERDGVGNTGYTRWTLQGLSGRRAGNL
uniref:Protein kinase domain-containing protein n=1 Tax=Eptatretus burgeri TaxID=7764 RepID=A0A8C4WZH0_EPTBU